MSTYRLIASIVVLQFVSMPAFCARSADRCGLTEFESDEVPVTILQLARSAGVANVRKCKHSASRGIAFLSLGNLTHWPTGVCELTVMQIEVKPLKKYEPRKAYAISHTQCPAFVPGDYTSADITVTPGEYLALGQTIEQQSCPNKARNAPSADWIDPLEHVALCGEFRRINKLRIGSISKQERWFSFQTDFQVTVERGVLPSGAFQFTVVRRFGKYVIAAERGIVY